MDTIHAEDIRVGQRIWIYPNLNVEVLEAVRLPNGKIHLTCGNAPYDGLAKYGFQAHPKQVYELVR